MKRPWQIWSAYCTALALVAAAVGWLSLRAWESDRAEQAAAEQANLEENVRLALWRMDSLLMPFVAEESARGPSDYQSPKSASARRDQNREETVVTNSDPPPPIVEQSPRVVLIFQIDPDGRVTSPQVPEALASTSTVAKVAPPATAGNARQRLDELKQFAPYNLLFARLPAAEMAFPAGGFARNPPINFNAQNFEQTADNSVRASRARGANEYQVRQQLATNVNTTALANGPETFLSEPNNGRVRVATMTPVLLKDHLLLARRIPLAGHELIQGCWLDWNAIRSELLAAISDLLPTADLRLAHGALANDQTRLLATLPVQLVPGNLPSAASDGISPIQLSLATAWCALLAAAVAVAVLLRGVIVLSERRADFVSAVTHELRTPLTTFRMYAEMLAEGMVSNDDDRRTYLNTLRVEADRLTHLVDNVLAYARLERGGLGRRMQTITADELAESAGGRLNDRASQAGFAFCVEIDERCGQTRVCADGSAVEQILFNLVDNACKYARDGGDRSLRLQVRRENGSLEMAVCDHGPGIPADQQRRLFQPFSRSGRDSANTAPGVGLGLALSRRLARDMGGDLVWDHRVTEGAAFVLTLPILETDGPSDIVPRSNPKV